MAFSNAIASSSGLARSSNLPVPGFARRETSSSYSSGSYPSLPPGRWTLNLHGNCTRCHHHHSAARFKVHISSDPSITTQIRCQACHEKWIAIGDPNSDQLSLLSVNSTRPDPVATEVRHSLINIVRATTPLATLSPLLTEIVEASSGPSRQPSFRIPPPSGAQTGDAPARPPLSNGFPALQPQEPVESSQPANVRPATTQKYGLMTGRRMSQLKASMGMHFPNLHRANLMSRLETIKQSRIAAKRFGKQPAKCSVPGEGLQGTSHVQDAATLGDPNADVEKPSDTFGTLFPEEAKDGVYHGNAAHGASGPVDASAALSTAAKQYLATLADDSTNLGNLTEEERAAWVRARYTDFKNGSTVSNNVHAMVSKGTETASELATEAHPNDQNASLHQRLSLDLFGIEDRQSQAGRAISVRTSTITISDRLSEVDTVIDDATTIASGPRYSLLEHMRRERVGSPRPLSLNAYTSQRSRRNRAQRLSMDSVATNEAIRSTSRPGSPTNKRFSQGSTLHLSPNPTHTTEAQSAPPNDQSNDVTTPEH